MKKKNWQKNKKYNIIKFMTLLKNKIIQNYKNFKLCLINHQMKSKINFGN